MKPWKKLLLGLAGVFALTALAACSSSTNTLDKVKDKGTLTVALNPHFAPFEFKTIQDGRILLLEQTSKLPRLLQMSLV